MSASDNKKKKRIIIAALVALVVCIAFPVVWKNVIVPNGKYNAAVDLMENGSYTEAITAFEAMEGYKDSEDKIADCLLLPQIETLSDAKAGDTVRFGYYEQNADPSDGKEEIEWIVLNVEDSKALLVSNYALDCQKYNDTLSSVLWEDCTLRAWLNDSFLNTAFDAKHLERIPTVLVPAAENPQYRKSGGNDTEDKVFLLSMTEAETYFPSDEERLCSATAYAKEQGASFTNTGSDACWYWLRSPGIAMNRASVVNLAGSVEGYGILDNYFFGAIRPAVWIELN